MPPPRYSRRDALKIGLAGTGALLLRPRRASARTPVKAAQVTSLPHTVHLVAESRGFFKQEGIEVELLASPSGARCAQMVAAGQVHFAVCDTSHPLRLTEQGKASAVLFVTDARCPYANIVVRRDLYDAGLTTIDKLGAMKAAGGVRWKIGCTAIGGGTWMYGSFILRERTAGGGKTLADLVEWIGVGGVRAGLGALKTRKIDLNMSPPELILEAEAQGFAKLIFDVRDDKQWQSVFKGPIPATGGCVLKATVRALPDETQAYVTAVYKGAQWLRTAAAAEIAAALEPYRDTMGLTKESLVRAVDWYKPLWTYDLAFSRESYEKLVNVAKGIKSEKAFPYEEIVDPLFLNKAAGRA